MKQGPFQSVKYTVLSFMFTITQTYEPHAESASLNAKQRIHDPAQPAAWICLKADMNKF